MVLLKNIDINKLIRYNVVLKSMEKTIMENQHRKIKGYRELSQEEIDKMNKIKGMGIAIGLLVEELENMNNIDQKWVEDGKITLQKGLMSLTRSVAKPEFF
jgi:hypothetical protein